MSQSHKSGLAQVDAERWLSTPRLKVYTAATSNLEEALNLYDWNSRLTSACSQDIGHLEVRLRNAYDKELSAASAPGIAWTNPQSPLWNTLTGNQQTRGSQQRLNTGSRGALIKAGGPTRTHGHVIAQMTFGFWQMLTVAPRTQTHWSIVKQAFPTGTTRGQVHAMVHDLVDFRNRLSHWEPVFSATTALRTRLEQVDELFNMLDPATAGWVGSRSLVPEILDESQKYGVPPVAAGNNYLGRIL